MFEVELQRELRGVERAEELAAVDSGDAVLERADEAQAVGGFVGLDVDDGGAVVGEDLGGDRADADPGEVGEFDAFEGEAGGGAVMAREGGALPGMAGSAFGSSRPAKNLVRVLGVFIEDLQEFRHALETQDAKAIEEFFQQAKERRDAWRAGTASPSPE